MERTMVIRSEALAHAACAHLMANWRAMAEEGRPLACRFYEYKDNRTLEQQALMWIRLGDISEQAWLDGRQFSAEVWHDHAKREFLPDEEGPSKRCRKGYRKWAFAPSGERVLVGSTTQLTVFGMSEYLTQLEAFGAGLGVLFSAPPWGYR